MNNNNQWAELLPDLVVLIAKKITLFDDFRCFGLVCSSWRAGASRKTFNRSAPQIPWLMLPENKQSPKLRDFYSPYKDKIVKSKVFLPEAAGKFCIGTTKGWLVTIAQDGSMKLLHPFSRVQIELPHQSTFVDYEEQETRPFIFISTAALSANPSETSDYIVMVIYGGEGYLGFWRAGDQSWTRVETREANCAYNDVVFHNGYMYMRLTTGDRFTSVMSWGLIQLLHIMLLKYKPTFLMSGFIW